MSHSPQPHLSDLANALSAALEEHLLNLDGQNCGNLHRLVLSSVEEELVKFAARKCGGNLSEAARMLGISRTTVARKLNGFAADGADSGSVKKTQPRRNGVKKRGRSKQE